jgi:TetR/AcrR family fatty acid metabolism transcriptional regulator
LIVRSDSDRSPSFIEGARRAQIIDVTIKTLASDGYVNTSLAKIAANAGVSKGVVSYHFAGKDALMEQIVEDVYRGIAERVIPQLVDLPPLVAVREHVLAVARDVVSHPDEIRAVGEIATHLRDPDGRPRFGVVTNEPLYAGLEYTYEVGQAAGDMWAFDRRTMAVMAQAALDSMFDYLHHHPERDPMTHAAALADLLVHAVAADPSAVPAPHASEES